MQNVRTTLRLVSYLQVSPRHPSSLTQQLHQPPLVYPPVWAMQLHPHIHPQCRQHSTAYHLLSKLHQGWDSVVMPRHMVQVRLPPSRQVTRLPHRMETPQAQWLQALCITQHRAQHRPTRYRAYQQDSPQHLW